MNPSEHTIQSLTHYCSSKNIVIHESIQAKHVLGRGLGVYATEQISPDEELVHVPVSEIFTTNNIPEHFLSKSAREGIAVHAQLAAFFAFGQGTDLEPYEAWMATWPVFADLFETMPMFWGNLLANQLEEVDEHNEGVDPERSHKRPIPKKQKVQNGVQTSKSQRPTSQEPTTGSEEGTRTVNMQSLSIIHDQVLQMAEKLVSHVKSIHRVLPDLQILDDSAKLTKFFHAWCLVNTRCFYYIPTVLSPAKGKASKPKAPADPNEAMALCPFMDLFNHTAPLPATVSHNLDDDSSQKPCKVASGVKGFTATTTSEVEADKEVLFSYGPHTNDTLWSEYGFLLPGSSNTSDSVLLDQTILQNLTEKQRLVLEDQDYLATYTLFNDGSVCYRTEMVAWLSILGTRKWTKVVEEGLDPADSVDAGNLAAVSNQYVRHNQTQSRPAVGGRHRHSQVISGWLSALQQQAQKDASELKSMEEDEILLVFKTLSFISGIDGQSAEEKLSLARKRQNMCIDRCEQISAMAARGVEAAISDSVEEI